MNAFELQAFNKSKVSVDIISMLKEPFWQSNDYYYRFLFRDNGFLIIGKVDFDTHNAHHFINYDLKKDTLIEKINVITKRSKYVFNNNNGLIHYRSNRHFEIMIAMVSEFLTESRSLGFTVPLKVNDFSKVMLEMKELCRIKPRKSSWLYQTMLTRLGFNEALFINDFISKSNLPAHKI